MTYCLMSIEIMISHFTCGVLGAAWRSVFALMSAATAPPTPSLAHSYSTYLYPQHTHDIHLGTLEHLSGSRSRCSFVFFAPLSRRCRCGRHAHVAGCGTWAAATDSASAARTPRCEGFSGQCRCTQLHTSANSSARKSKSWEILSVN